MVERAACRHAIWLLAAILPVLIVPELLGAFLPLAALALVVFVVCAARSGALRWDGRFSPPLLVLLIMLGVAYAVSGDRAASLPKATAIVAGLLLFGVFAGRGEGALLTGSVWLAVIGGGIGALGLVGADWQPGKLFTLWPVYDRLPRLISAVPRSTGGGFSANQLGGALAMCLPAAFGLWGYARTSQDDAWLRRQAVAALALMSAVLVLTQSRTAYIGAAAGVAVVLAPRLWPQSAPRLRWLTLAVAVLAPAVVLASLSSGVDLARLASAALAAGSTADDGATRAEVWTNAVRLVRDYAWTGGGLNRFPAVTWANYAYAWVPPDYPIWHSHNIYLQIAVDFGVPGLAAFLALLVMLALGALRVVAVLDGRPQRWLATGLAGSLVACTVAGLGDASTLPLGLKSGLPFWLAAGALAGAWRGTRQRPGLSASRRWWQWPAVTVGVALVVVAAPALARSVQVNRASLAFDWALAQAQGGRAAAVSAVVPALRASAGIEGGWQAVRLGRAQRLLGDDAAALSAWRQAPAEAIAYLNSQGDVHWRRRALVEAEADYRLALRVAPTAKTHYRLGRLLVDSQPDAALEFLALAQQTEGLSAAERADAHLLAGQIYAGRGQWQAASVQFNAGLAVLPSAGDLLVASVEAQAALNGNAALAEKLLADASASFPTSLPLYRALSTLYLRNGDVASARASAARALHYAPGSAWPHILMGRALLAVGRPADAADEFGRAAMMRRTLADPLLGLAEAYRQLDDDERAVAACQKASAVEPYKADVQVAAGDLLRSLGRNAAAGEAYERALSLDPNNEQALAGLAALGQTPLESR